MESVMNASKAKAVRTAPAKARSARAQYFVRLPYLLIDLGVIAVLGPEVVSTYFTLLSFVWRSQAGGRGLGSRYRSGSLSARVSQTKLGQLLGVNRQTVNRHIAKLAALGWVERVTSQGGGALIYELGSRTSGSQSEGGRTKERLFLDEWLEELLGRSGGNDPRERVIAARAFVHDALDVRPNEHARSNEQGVARRRDRVKFERADTRKREGLEREKSTSVEGEHTRSRRWRVPKVWEPSTCAAAYDAAKKKPVDAWPNAAFGGLFARRFEERFERVLAPASWKHLQSGLERIIQAHGRTWARDSIIAIFHRKQWNWVRDPVGLLAKPDVYEDIVMGLVDLLREKYGDELFLLG